jgi:putative RNA 2'-phosphotransferase
MNTKDDVRVSKLLSLVLRHDPGAIGLTLDSEGWAQVEDLIARLPFPASHDDIKRVVRDNDKQRFKLSEDGTRIRANQGHSVNVDLGLHPVPPPATLFHGTTETATILILAEGLKKMSRQHVHLSGDIETATKVGVRHGKPVILTVDCAEMVNAGLEFYHSDNGVWLTDHVPPAFINRL